MNVTIRTRSDYKIIETTHAKTLFVDDIPLAVIIFMNGNWSAYKADGLDERQEYRVNEFLNEYWNTTRVYVKPLEWLANVLQS